MFIYELEGAYNEKDDIIYEYDYLVHEKEFTEEEFEQICTEGLDTILDRDIFELYRFLIVNYNFKVLPTTRKFSFECD